MFRFTIRELLLLTVIVATSVGWWADHHRQSAAVSYYTEQYQYWRDSVELLDGMLTKLGFQIKREDFSKTYVPPPSLMPNPSAPAKNVPTE
jgi:hypothetical protein